MSAPAERHALAVAVLGGAAGGGLALLGASRPWAGVEVAARGVPATDVSVAGSSAVPWVGALALVVLSGALALVPTGGLLRRVVGAVLALAAVGVAFGVVTAGPQVHDALTAAVQASAASGGVDVGAVVAHADAPWWRWLSLVGSATGAVAGGWALARGHRWQTMGSRYEAPGADGPPPVERDPWRSIDAGRDPTL